MAGRDWATDVTHGLARLCAGTTDLPGVSQARDSESLGLSFASFVVTPVAGAESESKLAEQLQLQLDQAKAGADATWARAGDGIAASTVPIPHATSIRAWRGPVAYSS